MATKANREIQAQWDEAKETRRKLYVDLQTSMRHIGWNPERTDLATIASAKMTANLMAMTLNVMFKTLEQHRQD